MDLELKRIKGKDFSQIDEKLYDDLSRADNLTSTLSQLSDFQRFLMEQITSLNQNQPNINSTLIARSIARNFDHLKESLVKCSRIQEKSDKSKLIGFKEQLKHIKEQLKKAKIYIKQKVQQTNIKSQQALKSLGNEVSSKIESQRKRSDSLTRRYQQLQMQNEKLKQQNSKLKDLVESQTNQQIEIVNEKKTVEQKKQRLPKRLSIVQDYQTIIKEYQTPLKESNYLQQMNQNVQKDEDQKKNRNQISEGLQAEITQKRTNSLKRQTSNHQISRKTHINCFRDKENENYILKSKGVPLQELKRGRSKQKIKLVSMF